MTRIAILAGGVGGAKLAHGMALVARRTPGIDVSVIVNTADDMELHGLSISPDLDTVMYTLAGVANPETGWGVRDETWSNAGMLARYGAPTWFRLGDRDLATHLVRTERLRAGERLTDVTSALTARLGVPETLLPMADQPVRTHVRTDHGWLAFQDWFVRRRQADPVRELRYDGVADATLGPEVRDAIGRAQLVIVAPSNPFLSVAPILAVPGMRDALDRSPAPRIAVSPIVAGAALKGPADRMLVSLGGEASALGVCRYYAERHAGLIDRFVIDRLDADQAPAVERLGMSALVGDTVMRSEDDRARLAQAILESTGQLRA